jgi:hypothetical protein
MFRGIIQGLGYEWIFWNYLSDGSECEVWKKQVMKMPTGFPDGRLM